jgi:hypothetical protein
LWINKVEEEEVKMVKLEPESRKRKNQREKNETWNGVHVDLELF